MMRLRYPIEAPPGRKLRVLEYARYSTEEQHPSSITDQFSFCDQFLASAGVKDAHIERISDPEISGELVSRPGIDQVKEGIRTRRWDLLLVEDSGRFFRHETACGEMIEKAVDQDIRVIAINDDVDTAEEGWEDPLHEAMRHHARTNRYTAKRIKRKLDALWRMGAAVGQLRPGYLRKATNPDAEERKKKGPFHDEVDPKWAPVVYGVYERIAKNDPPWHVAQWLTEQGLPKAANAACDSWTDKNVIALIKNQVYRGVEVYRDKIVRKHYGTGEHRLVRNNPKEILNRQVPEMRIVPDWLWYAANKKIEDRTTRNPAPPGIVHPLAGVPRDSREPLSGIFICGVANCGAKMHVDGRREGGYRCSNAARGLCWNKANPLRSLVHRQIGKAITDRLLSLDGTLEAVVDCVRDRMQDDGGRKARLAKLQSEEQQLMTSRNRLLDAIEQAKEPPAVLLERLAKREEDVARVRAEIDRLKAEQALPQQLPSRQQIANKIKEMATQILNMDRDVIPDLRRLAPVIRAVPHQQFGTNQVVLRAVFELRMVALLPDQMHSLLEGSACSLNNTKYMTVPITVDLFERSAGPRYGLEALAFKEQGLTLEGIGRRLGIAKRQAHIATTYGAAMAAAGITDPYLELKDALAAASRWRTHPRFKDKTTKGTQKNNSATVKHAEAEPALRP